MFSIEINRIGVIFRRHGLSLHHLQKASRPRCILARDHEPHLATASVVGVRARREYDPRLDALGMERVCQRGQRLRFALSEHGLFWRILFHASILSPGHPSSPQ